MPPVVPVRELSVTEVNQIQHKRNVVMIAGLAIVFIGAFFISLRDLSPVYTVGIIFLLGFFLVSFINIRVGFLLIIAAFLFSPEINFPMSSMRGLTIRIEDLLIIVLLLAWLGRLAMGLQKHFIINTPLNMPILAIIIWNIISSWRAVSAGMVDVNLSIFTNLKMIEFFMVYFLVVNNISEVGEVKFMIYILLFVTLVVGLYAVIQIPKTQIFTVNRLTTPFEDRPEPSTLGGYLAMFFGVAFSILLYSEKSVLKKLSLILVLLLPLPIMFSLSRTSYLAVIGIVLSLAIISRKKWLIFGIIIFFVLSPFILPKAVLERALYNFHDARYMGFLDQSAAERVFIYKKAWGYVCRYTIFGGGIGAGGGIIDSQYARIIIETGIVGLSLFIWLIFRLFKMGFYVFRNSAQGWIKGLAIGFITVVIGMLVHSYGAISFCIVRIAEPFWALTALIAYIYYNTYKDNSAGLDFKN